MEVKPRRLETYRTKDGDHPYDSWLLGLRDKKGRGVIRNKVDGVEDGNLANCEPVGEGVFELKINFGPGYRVYFGEDGDTIVLLWGGDKSTQVKDILKAKTYWRNHNAQTDE